MNLKGVKTFLSQNSPTILTVMGIVGTVSTAVMASQATSKAKDIIHENKAEDADWRDKVALTWKCYIPTALMGVSTVGCIVGSHLCNEGQKTALQSAYLLSQTTLQEYQKRVIARIGEKKEREVYAETVKEVAAQQPLYSSGDIGDKIVDTGRGNTLFYDTIAQQYFKSDINCIKAAVNELNYEVRTEMYFDWNEILYRWGLPLRKYGSELIFDVDRPLEVRMTPEMMDNGQVRILLDYDLFPKSTYERWGK